MREFKNFVQYEASSSTYRIMRSHLHFLAQCDRLCGQLSKLDGHSTSQVITKSDR
ncbi:hypothetical protein [Allocoleopsis sp.]|uniref:hypothetical protein n=1 Tax=Allocoleopsis sp. TaxID=3088169 RepID=UPI002FCFBA07